MLRRLHRWPGLIAAVLLVVISLSGAVLSLTPSLDGLSAPSLEAGLSVGTLAGRVKNAISGLEQIRRSADGTITAYWFDAGVPGAAVIDPATGAPVASADPSAFMRFVTNLHRSLFLDDGGRIATALASVLMLVLSLSGVVLVARRTGGWRRIAMPLKGPLAGRLHAEIARLAVAGLILSSLTGLWMSASTFDLTPQGVGIPPFPQAVSGMTGMAPQDMVILNDTPVSSLRELSFPMEGDASDAYKLRSDAGSGFIDQGTGTLLSWNALSGWDQVNETILMLHTGKGAAWLGLLLGLCALGVPVMAATGVIVYAGNRAASPRMPHNDKVEVSDTILLIGSEGGSTYGFAGSLQRALQARGHRVHAAAMNAFAPQRYAKARRILVMAATYGDGDAPQSARQFLTRLDGVSQPNAVAYAVLGFGDRSFPAYCAYAGVVDAALAGKGHARLMPYDTIDRQSPQEFARWCDKLGETLGETLNVNHSPAALETCELTLIERRDYGLEVQAPTSILRFALPEAGLFQRLRGRSFSCFSAGDLLSVLPQGSSLPRLYSLASGHDDGFIEICVRKMPGGLCSDQLLTLQPGDTIRAGLKPNPGFRPSSSKKPLILIGAGTGIGPLAGFVRANARRKPIHLYFGARNPDSDFLYDRDLEAWLEDGRLTTLQTAFSRSGARMHVQHALVRDGAAIARLIADGASILVCGGRDMAAGVRAALGDILIPHGLTPAMLKAEGRYGEDVY